MAESDRVRLGEITGAHGVKGEVKIRAYTERPEDICAYGPLSDEAGARLFKILSVRVLKNGVVGARLEGVSDRNAAEALRGTRLYIPRARLPEPGENEWYHSDLIGLRAQDPEGCPLGSVIAVHNFGAGDLLEIRPPGSRKTLLVPFTSDCVPEVNVMSGTVVVRLPEEVSGEEQQ